MSALCIVEFNSNKLEFAELNSLSNEIVSNALGNKYAVFFNDVYAEQIIKPKAYNNTILISESFLDRNSDDLFDVTDYVCENEIIFKENFLKKFNFFNQIFKILFRYQVSDVNIYFTEDGNQNLDDYLRKEVLSTEISDKLYEVFIQFSRTTGFTFPDINFRVLKN